MSRVRLRVKEVAKEKGMSMIGLVRRSEVALGTVRSIYHDPFRTVNIDTLKRLADALGVSIHNLIEEVPDEKEEEDAEK